MIDKFEPLIEVPFYPDRKGNQERFDVAIRNAVNGGAVVVKELNTKFIPVYNKAIPNFNMLLANIPDINIVAGISSAVTRVAQSADNVDRVKESIDKVDRVNESILAVDRLHVSIDKVDRVNDSIAAVDRVNESITAIDVVNSNITAVVDVHTNMDAVAAVSTNMDAVTTTSTSIEDVVNTSNNMDAVIAAPTHAAEAKYWAEFAKDVVDIGPSTETESGIIRIATVDEVKAGTATLLAITPATLRNRLKTAVNTAQTYYFANTGGF